MFFISKNNPHKTEVGKIEDLVMLVCLSQFDICISSFPFHPYFGIKKRIFQFPTVTVCPQTISPESYWDFTADMLDQLHMSEAQNREFFSFIPQTFFETNKT